MAIKFNLIRSETGSSLRLPVNSVGKEVKRAASSELLT
jgi:hypothetical protein